MNDQLNQFSIIKKWFLSEKINIVYTNYALILFNKKNISVFAILVFLKKYIT